MKLSEYQGEDALDLLADVMEPLVDIMADEGLKKAVSGGASKIVAVQYLLKNHKKEILAILARIDGVAVEDYKCNALTLPLKIVELLNDDGLKELFTSQGQTMANAFSGSATETTEASVG